MSTTIIYSTSKDTSIKNSEEGSSQSSSPNNSDESSSRSSAPKNSGDDSSKASSSKNSEDNSPKASSGNNPGISSSKDQSCKNEDNTSTKGDSGNNSNNMSIGDKDVALDLLTASKTTVTTLTKVITESTNSQVRELLRNQLTLCINSHYRLSDIAINKGWYNVYVEPSEQLKQDIGTIKNLT